MVLVLEPVERFAAVYRPRMLPWMTPDHRKYLGAIAWMFEQVYELVTDEGIDGDPDYVPGWGTLLDPDVCPAEFLPYLGQFVGVSQLQGVAEKLARAQIKAQVAMHRGTPASIIDAAASTLTGSQAVTLIERDPLASDPAYSIRVITYTSQTPDQAATLAAILRVKPAGIFLTYEVKDGQTWGHLRDEQGGRTWGQVLAEYASWAAARDKIPS